MEPLPHPPNESPAKGAAHEQVEPGSIARFKALAKRLFAVERGEFQNAVKQDAEIRRTKSPKRASAKSGR